MQSRFDQSMHALVPIGRRKCSTTTPRIVLHLAPRIVFLIFHNRFASLRAVPSDL